MLHLGPLYIRTPGVLRLGREGIVLYQPEDGPRPG